MNRSHLAFFKGMTSRDPSPLCSGRFVPVEDTPRVPLDGAPQAFEPVAHYLCLQCYTLARCNPSGQPLQAWDFFDAPRLTRPNR